LIRIAALAREKWVISLKLLKRSALALGGAFVLLGATIGLTQAQTAAPASVTKQQHEAVINLAATKLGLTGDQLTQALASARKDLGLNQGRPQAAKLARTELTIAATTLGYPDLKSMRKDLAGTTLTALANKRNVAPANVANAMKADLDAKIQAMVTAGKLKADRAATAKQKAEARIDALMTREFKAASTT
jgi:hypothetical protein